jgi:hypothetical protein
LERAWAKWRDSVADAAEDTAVQDTAAEDTTREDTAAQDTAVEIPVCGDGLTESGYVCSGSPSVCTPAPSPANGDAQCEPTYGSSVYDAFPGSNGSYPKGNSNTYGWPGDDFESYSHDEITDVDPAVRVYISSWQSGGPQWSGAHIFARYQTQNDLYVASLRKDGKVYIKLKHCDAYTTLAGASFSQGAVQTGTWYGLRFEVVGQRLRLYVDGQLELEAFDDMLFWGTTGVRSDYGTFYLDDWEHR